MNSLRLTRNQYLKLAQEWAEYEEEHGTLILGYSLKFLLIYYFYDDLLHDVQHRYQTLI